MESSAPNKKYVRSLLTATLFCSLLSLCNCSTNNQADSIDGLPDPGTEQVSNANPETPAQTDEVPPAADPSQTMATTETAPPPSDVNPEAPAANSQTDAQAEIARLTDEKVQALRQVKIARAEREMQKAKEAEDQAAMVAANPTPKKHAHHGSAKKVSTEVAATTFSAVVDVQPTAPAVTETTIAANTTVNAQAAQQAAAQNAQNAQRAAAQAMQQANNDAVAHNMQTNQARNPASAGFQPPAPEQPASDSKHFVVVGALIALMAGGAFWLARKKAS